MSGYEDLVRQARSRITEITIDDLAARSDGVTLIDVREPHEMATGVIPGAHLVPRGAIEKGAPHVALDRSADVVLYCTVGNRSALAADVLEQMGYTSVASLAGGIALWRAAGHPIDMPAGAADDRARYARHLVMEEIGPEGQERLARSTALVVGAGGLGSPAALYLAAAGVGTLRIADYDVVDVSNLQRQVLHDTDRIGLAKAESAAMTLARLNPQVAVDARRDRVTAATIEALASGCDVIVDGTDSFPARYLLNDAALRLGIPLVHGSVLRFEGQAMVVDPHRSPCYRCVFPAPPPPDLSPSCADAGVLGAVTGVIGSLQAAETIKLLLGIGEPLVGRLLVYDGLAAETRGLRIARNPDCPACGDPERLPALVDYDDTCRPPAE